MKKILGIIVLGLVLSSNAYAKKGSGELKLSKQVMTEVMMYMFGASNPKYSDGANKKNKPMLMTVSKDGKSSHYYYCPYSQCETGNYIYISIKKCEKRSGGSPCFLFANKRKIVWDNGVDIKSKSRRIKKKLLKEPFKIAQIIQDLGFYDSDISKLPGIDYDTAKIDDTKKISGKIDNFDYPSLIASLTSEHKIGWKDYVRGGKEKYKAWVMAKQKKGYMTWSFEADNTSWENVIRKAFNRCDGYMKEKPKNYSKSTICILYYKGTTPTTDKEKIETAQNYYGEDKAYIFFEDKPYVLDDPNNFINKKKKITKETTQSKDLVSQIKELKELLDSGVINKEEFEKAKKKLLN